MSGKQKTVPPPARRLPDASWDHYGLYCNVREALAAVPVYFRSETHIAGVMATDLYTLNSVLGATIEEQVVRTLNLIRNVWDPDHKYSLYNFVRQPQTFPDVRLRRVGGGDTLLGVELKGWYLLAKETEPSLRFQTTAAACAPADLIVVVPWVLGNVISGTPVLFEPFIESARYAAEHRNHHWQHVRECATDCGIAVPSGIGPYPMKADQISDRPKADGGGNFGRLARTGIMDDYVKKLEEVSLCGIKTVYWRDFLKAFQESSSDAQARAAIERLRIRIQSASAPPSLKSAAALQIALELERMLDDE
jgi:hypothetical protein